MALIKARKKRVALLASSTLALGGMLAAVVPGAASAGNGDFQYTVQPLTKQLSVGVPAALPTPSQCVALEGLACYIPQEIRRAYDIPDGATGAGESIAIIDAYGSPTIQSDLDTFDAEFGLPDTTVHIYYPTGKPKTETAHKGQPLSWAEETSLDVEWAHAIAPAATINLIVASNNFGNVLGVAERYAVDNKLGDVISMSYGAPESALKGNNLQIAQSHATFQEAADKGISVFASAGDSGATAGGTSVSALYPASDPLVTGVGGTNLFADDDGNYVGETVWNDSDPAQCPFGCTDGVFGATGGAPSAVFPTPAYQSGSTRTMADVSYNASVYTSVLVYLGFFSDPSQNGFYFFGGTSSGSPQWAAIGALADQATGHDLGQLNPKLYALAANPSTYAADFHDVTMGDNGFFGPGFSAGTGYDIPTGLGSPNVAPLIASLASQ